MSNTPRFTVDKQELAFRQDIATVAYNSAFQLNAINDGSAAILTFQYDRVQDAFPAFADLIDKGWSIPAGMEHTYVTVTPAIPGHSLSAFVEINLVKPVAQREEDLRVIHKTVEEKYKAELQLQREQEIDRVVEQQLQAERRNALAKQSQKEQAERERIRAQVDAAIAGGKQ